MIDVRKMEHLLLDRLYEDPGNVFEMLELNFLVTDSVGLWILPRRIGTYLSYPPAKKEKREALKKYIEPNHLVLWKIEPTGRYHIYNDGNGELMQFAEPATKKVLWVNRLYVDTFPNDMNNVYYTDQFLNKIFVIEDGTEKLNGVIRAASYQEKE